MLHWFCRGFFLFCFCFLRFIYFICDQGLGGGVQMERESWASSVDCRAQARGAALCSFKNYYINSMHTLYSINHYMGIVTIFFFFEGSQSLLNSEVTAVHMNKFIWTIQSFSSNPHNYVHTVLVSMCLSLSSRLLPVLWWWDCNFALWLPVRTLVVSSLLTDWMQFSHITPESIFTPAAAPVTPGSGRIRLAVFFNSLETETLQEQIHHTLSLRDLQVLSSLSIGPF